MRANVGEQKATGRERKEKEKEKEKKKKARHEQGKYSLIALLPAKARHDSDQTKRRGSENLRPNEKIALSVLEHVAGAVSNCTLFMYKHKHVGAARLANGGGARQYYHVAWGGKRLD